MARVVYVTPENNELPPIKGAVQGCLGTGALFLVLATGTDGVSRWVLVGLAACLIMTGLIFSLMFVGCSELTLEADGSYVKAFRVAGYVTDREHIPRSTIVGVRLRDHPKHKGVLVVEVALTQGQWEIGSFMFFVNAEQEAAKLAEALGVPLFVTTSRRVR